MIPMDMFYFIVVQDGLGLMYRERAFLVDISRVMPCDSCKKGFRAQGSL